MVVRSMLSGMMLAGVVLILLVTGCARKAPVTSETGETSMGPRGADGSVEELAQRERERRQAIEERERQMQMQSMRQSGAERLPQDTVAYQEFLEQDVPFSFDSYTLSDEAEAILDRKADWLRSNPGATVQIEGHCDERGTTAYNLALGEHRANAVKRYLTALGIDAARLTTISYGEEVPLDPRRNEEAWARNRRAHFVITSQ